MKKWFRLLVVAGILALCAGWSVLHPAQVRAQSDLPLDIPTCKHGVHLLSPSDEDFKRVASLINSNGGKNCWVTIVIRQDEMTAGNLQRINNLARENELQIVYRLERGFDQNHEWLMPNRATTQKFIDAISGLKGEPKLLPYSTDMYIQLGNEPTHRAMCGGCTPKEMANWMMESIQMLHQAGKDLELNIHVGMGAHDLATPQDLSNGLYDAGYFMEEMFRAEPRLLCEVDLWFSHNYPRSFVGRASGGVSGRLSPYGYEWELSFARSKALPECVANVDSLKVFITETGYRVGPGGVSDDFAYVESAYMLDRYAQDDRVFGFTLFAYVFCTEPFDVFAVAGCDGNTLNGVGRALREAPKVRGDVRHIHRARTVVTCPERLVENIEVECLISAENLGTDIWKDIEGDYGLRVIGADPGAKVRFSRFRAVRPGDTLTANLHYNPGKVTGGHDVTIGLERDGRLLLGLAAWRAVVFEAPEVALQVKSVVGTDVTVEKAQMQVLDMKDDHIFSAEFAVKDGRVLVGKIPGVMLDTCYRVVLLVDKNLPVQKECYEFTDGLNEIEMPRLMAIDRNSDGKLSLADVLDQFQREL